MVFQHKMFILPMYGNLWPTLYYKFLRTHHAHGACYHFGTGITSVSKMQYTTQRVYSKRDLFKTLTSTNIARDHHNRITHQFIDVIYGRGIFLLLFAILLHCEITTSFL